MSATMGLGGDTSSLEIAPLSKLAHASRSDLIVYSLTAFLAIRLAQSRERKCPISQTAGCSSSLSSRSRSSRRIWWLVISGIKFERPLRRVLPALLKWQSKKECWWSSEASTWHNWQVGEEFGFLTILCTRSWVGSKLWSSLHRKVGMSGPKPFSLANLHVLFGGLSVQNKREYKLFLTLCSDWVWSEYSPATDCTTDC